MPVPPKRRRLALIAGAIGIALLAIAFTQWRAAISRNRSIPDEPFQIAGNLYYVGSTGITAFLIAGPEGHILIDGGYPETAPLIIGSMAKLGYNIADVKVLLNSHAHFDHAGGLQALKEASGAALWVSEQDADVIEAGGKGDRTFGPFRHIGLGRFTPARVDHRFSDGQTIRVGPNAVTAHVTAGHTPGCTTWSIPVQHGEQTLLAVSVCSLTILPFMSFGERESYPGIGADFERSFQTLRALPADIFLASHGSFFELARKKRERATADDPVTPFLDRAGYLAFIDRAEAAYRKEISKE